MKILMVSLFLPYPPDNGSKMRVYNFLRHLSRNNEIILVSFVDSLQEQTYIHKLYKYCKEIYTYLHPPKFKYLSWLLSQCSSIPPTIQRSFSLEVKSKIDALLKSTMFDAVLVENLPMAQYIYSYNMPCKILDEHNIVHHIAQQRYRAVPKTWKGLLKRLLFYIAFLRIRRYEIKTWKRFHKLIVCSDVDLQQVKSLQPDKVCEVIPNGFDASNIKLISDNKNEPRIIFVGTMKYLPNEDGILYFHREIFPLIRRKIPDVELLIVGNQPSTKIKQLSVDQKVIVTGYVQDVHHYYKQSKLAVVPLRYGSGIKLKILEAFALGKPVVSTSVGCEGLELQDGKHLIIADEPEKFAEAVIKLLTDEPLRYSLSRNARELVETKYDWSIITKKLDSVFQINDK